MASKPWHGPKWPEGVSPEVTDYQKPLSSILDDAARDYPDQTYTIFAGATRTFQQVKEIADRIACFLASRGLKKGDPVAIFLPNLPHYPPVFFGILKAGGICVTCNPRYVASELNFQLKDCGARAVFVMDHPEFYPTALKALEGTQVHTVVICNVKTYLPSVKGLLGSVLGKIPKAPHHQPGHFTFDQVIKTSKARPPEVPIHPDQDPAVILYTGGTTGVPKGAVLTNANVFSVVRNAEEWVRLRKHPGEPLTKLEKGGFHTYLGVLPWYHSFGLSLVMLGSCINASRLVCIPDPRAGNPPFTDVLEQIQKYRVTIVVAVPLIYSAMVNHPLVDKFDLTTIMACGSGAAPLPVEVIKQFEEKTGAVIFEGYGLTETSPVLTINPTNTEQRKIGSVGLPMPGTNIKIIDMETGSKEMSQGEDGEIAACGLQVMKRYWNNPETSDTIFAEIEGRSYFLTGDIGHIDEEGFLFITDRKKDLILVGGFNVYPKEVEEVLYTHPAVAAAAVVGVPDSKSGEAVKAYIQLKSGAKATERDILDFCSSRLAGYRRPRQIEFRDSLPTSIVGKILKRVLREEKK